MVIEMAKRNVKMRKKELEVEENVTLKNTFIVILVVLIFLGVFYLITVKVTNSETGNSDDEEMEAEIQTEEILVGSSFNRAGDEYLVVYYDKSDSALSSISSKIYEYRNKTERIPLYEADMSNVFNKEYVTDKDVNKEPKEASEIMINGATLIKFKDKKVVDYVEGQDDILNYLN